MILFKKWLWLAGAYGLGVASVFVFGLVLDMSLPWNHPWTIEERWKFHEDSPGHLALFLSETPGILVDIKCDPESGALESAALLREGVGAVFKYEVEGEFGTPRAEYVGGRAGEMEGMSWVDLNADGYFDLRYDFVNTRAEIRLSGNWVKAVVKSGKVRPGSMAETDEGKFEFDSKSGDWRPVESTAGYDPGSR